MIPTLILAGLFAGLLIGRWWTVAAAAVAWSALLLIAGGIDDAGSVLAAAAIAVPNAAAGFLPGWLLRRLAWRLARLVSDHAAKPSH
jgi:hypothetical protein